MGSYEGPVLDTVFYAPSVVNSPGGIQSDMCHSRERLTQIVRRPVRLEATEKLEAIRQRDKEHYGKPDYTSQWTVAPNPPFLPTYGQVECEYSEKEKQIGDPTTLIMIDEADRLRMASLEQVRSIFDAAEIGLILIGMPGL